jgi:cobalt-zinc-cadmium efflux system protein
VTLHARVAEAHSPDTTLTAIKARLRDRFGIGHATVEVEQGGCADARHDC